MLFRNELREVPGIHAISCVLKPPPPEPGAAKPALIIGIAGDAMSLHERGGVFEKCGIVIKAMQGDENGLGLFVFGGP